MRKGKIVYYKGDMFTALFINAYAHGCNTKGAMGAGVAGRFRELWPKLYESYKAFCKANRAVLGECFRWERLDDKGSISLVVFNLFTQPDTGPCAEEEYVYDAVRDLLFNCQELHRDKAINLEGPEPYVVAMPLVGSGIGGLSKELSWLTIERAYFDHAGPKPDIALFVHYVKDTSPEKVEGL